MGPGEWGWRITNLEISREVFRVRRPCVWVGFVERARMRQEAILGVYNGEPGFGLNRARYYISVLMKEWAHFCQFCSLETCGLGGGPSRKYDQVSLHQ